MGLSGCQSAKRWLRSLALPEGGVRRTGPVPLIGGTGRRRPQGLGRIPMRFDSAAALCYNDAQFGVRALHQESGESTLFSCETMASGQPCALSVPDTKY